MTTDPTTRDEIAKAVVELFSVHPDRRQLDCLMGIVASAVLHETVQANANNEAGYLADEGGFHPDWIYRARRNRQVAENGVPWLGELHKALGWHSGTIHAALSAVARLVAVEKERERKSAS